MDVDKLLSELTLEEKVALTAGADTWRSVAIERLGVPSITTSDGPHGVRGTSFFNSEPAALLPSATGMGATFDTELMEQVGDLLGKEARARNIHAFLGPTVCIQRSPLIGRGFEAFGEDPVMSGNIAASLINGMQKHKVGAIIKHYAAHDQSAWSIEDNIVASERTLREVHLLPFHIAAKKSNPWGYMTSYNKINGTHVAEHPHFLNEVLRQDWGWKGLVMSDWGGTYSTSEAINAGLDLEMPGPTKWRGNILTWAVNSRKVSMAALDAAVRNVLEFINKVKPAIADSADLPRNDAESKALVRRVASESIVLLKNDKKILPLDKKAGKKFGLIGPHWHLPAASGGGSADLNPYYISKPYDAFVEAIGGDVPFQLGCYTHRFSPLLTEGLTIPSTSSSGLILEWFSTDPTSSPDAKPIATVTTQETYMFLADSLPANLPPQWFLRVRTLFTAPRSTPFRIGLCVIGKGKLSFAGKEVINLWTSHPEKTGDTPMFNAASSEVTADVQLEEGKGYEIEVLVVNDGIEKAVGAMPTAGVRIGGYEIVDEEKALDDAVKLAKEVEIPVVLTGLTKDWEYEGSDRTDLGLPGRTDELIRRVTEANPNTVVVTQAGSPIAMPWLDSAGALVHAWFGGQETGRALVDVLFGDVNPCGKLSQTFPKRLEDTPAFLTFGKADYNLHYGEGVFVGYRYHEKVDRPPLFYFGHGLSYTEFEYSSLVVPDEWAGGADHVVTVKVDVKNSGDKQGREVVQVYVSDTKSSVLRPLKELKAFKKVDLAPGEAKTIEIELDKYALSFWDEKTDKWLAEKGAFEVIIARSADPKSEVLKGELTLGTSFSWTGV
ncbi:Glycosyl hydrolase family 3 C-terminal domain-containing protein 7 [Elsinoe fawcettii]|nr:Glycosyl hydrolase family 3 C-terminal domain-containing protein 7 [Elsinoe fawcettii]